MDKTDVAVCALCGEPMPPGETMFKYHGYSGPCPKPPLPRQPTREERLTEAVRVLTEALEHAKSQIQHPDQMIDDALTTAKELTK